MFLTSSEGHHIKNGLRRSSSSGSQRLIFLILRGEILNILVACEESQVVCIAFRKAGHSAFSCDLQDCSGNRPEWHIKEDVLPLINGKCSFNTCDGLNHTIENSWDMIIAFPPCTYISNAGSRHLYKNGKLNHERFNKGLAARDFFMKIYNADCKKICIENPIHNSIYGIPPFSQQIQPYYFGHPVMKTTRLWLKGLPILWATDLVACTDTFLPTSSGRKGICSSHKSIDRSKTFSGIASAMAAQWG